MTIKNTALAALTAASLLAACSMTIPGLGEEKKPFHPRKADPAVVEPEDTASQSSSASGQSAVKQTQVTPANKKIDFSLSKEQEEAVLPEEAYPGEETALQEETTVPLEDAKPASVPVIPQQPVRVEETKAVPVAPDLAQDPPELQNEEDYVLGIEDVMEISVLGEADLNKVSVRVSPKGTVEFPFIGEVAAQGIPVGDFRMMLVNRLNEYYVEPQVSIFLKEYKSRMVNLLGQIARPGPYRITHGNTLMEVITRAGGFTDIADQSHVKIIRKAGGTENVLTVDCDDIMKKGKIELDRKLEPGDMIIVPESFF